jgi:hypothetical protein
MKTNPDRVLTLFAATLSVAVVGAGVYLEYVSAGRSWAYLLAIAVICIGWIARRLVGDDVARRRITQALVWACALLAVSFSAKMGAYAGWAASPSSEISERVLGIMLGAFVVVLANTIPKRVISARGLTMLRVGAWALVLGGVGYALAWLLLPLPYADTAALFVMLAGVVTCAAVVIVWWRAKVPCEE